MDYEDKVIYNTISLRGLVLHTFIAFTSKLPIDNLSNFVISYYIPEVVDFINNSGIKRGTMTVDKFKDLYGIKIDYTYTCHFASKNAIIAILFHIRIDMKWWKDTLNV